MSSVAEKLARKSNRRPPAKQVRLRLVYIDFWSAVKLSFLVAVCLAVISIVVTFLIHTVLSSTGIFEQVNSLVQDVAGSSGDLTAVLSLGNVMGFAVVVGAVEPRRDHRARRDPGGALQPQRQDHGRPAGRLHEQLTAGLGSIRRFPHRRVVFPSAEIRGYSSGG